MFLILAAGLEERLEVAAVEVTQMRESIGQMGQRLQARDKAVAVQLQVSNLQAWRRDCKALTF